MGSDMRLGRRALRPLCAGLVRDIIHRVEVIGHAASARKVEVVFTDDVIVAVVKASVEPTVLIKRSVVGNRSRGSIVHRWAKLHGATLEEILAQKAAAVAGLH